LGLAAELAGTGVRLTWASTLDCDGNAVAGYNLYRRSAAEQTYTRLNTALIGALTYTDMQSAALSEGETYYYAITAVDSSSDESVKSAPASVTVANSGDGDGDGGGGGGNGGGCFIASAGWVLSPELLKPLAAMALLICLAWISRRKGKQ
jgi:hypothetical protein